MSLFSSLLFFPFEGKVVEFIAVIDQAPRLGVRAFVTDSSVTKHLAIFRYMKAA